MQLRGRILDGNGDPVGGAHVRVTTQRRIVAQASADAGGASRSTGYRQVARAWKRTTTPEGRSRARRFSCRRPRRSFPVLEPAAVRGHVADADDGHPIMGATLSALGSEFPVAQATSDASGDFVFNVVPFDATGIVAVAGGYRALRVALGPREGKPEPVLRIDLHGGPPLEGDVVDSDGKGIRAHVVACEGQPYETSIDSADDGTFRLPAQAVGCDAIATMTRWRRATRRRSPQAAERRYGSVAAEPSPASSSTIAGPRSIPSHGRRVVHPRPRHERATRGRHAISRRSLSLRAPRSRSYVLTAATAGLPPSRTSPVVVRSDGTTDVRITIAAGGAVVGRVVDGHGAPLAGVELRFDLVSAVAGSDAVATTDGIGRYRLEGAPSGPLTLRAQKEGYRMKLVSGLSVVSGRTVTKDIVLTEANGGPGLELGGIGANISRVGGGIGIAAVFPGDPADRAGLRQGDRIVRIDADDATGMSVVDAIQRLRGEPGTLVGISIERGGALIDVLVTRAIVVH